MNSMWFSKVSRHTPGYQSHNRGEVLSEWVVAKSLSGVSDIDVTLMKQIRRGWGLRDHNLIQI